MRLAAVRCVVCGGERGAPGSANTAAADIAGCGTAGYDAGFAAAARRRLFGVFGFRRCR
jgi:hypothetical protein